MAVHKVSIKLYQGATFDETWSVGDKMFIPALKGGDAKVNYPHALGNTRSELTRGLII